VLLKAFDRTGLVFYTNYESRKADQMAVNPAVAAVFHWQPLHRQVLIEGWVAKVDAAVSDAYFESRPPEARLASAASPQSRVVNDRAALDGRLDDLKARFPDGQVPRPDHWGGYRIVPDYYEYWQGREARFHDRFRYTPDGSGWRIERLAP
jgi:pyridoxamine 5'-phosphate oxidase